jgi:nitronate monooxygenase
MSAAKLFPTNKFCNAFRVSLPVILAPMGGIAGSDLASAVANAGGLGFVGTGGQNPHTALHYVGFMVSPFLPDPSHL